GGAPKIRGVGSATARICGRNPPLFRHPDKSHARRDDRACPLWWRVSVVGDAGGGQQRKEHMETATESTPETQPSPSDAPITIREMMEAGVHFGHQTKRWNPKMKSFIFGARNGIHIIDLQQTVRAFKRAYNFLVSTIAQGRSVLFVGTKKQAQEVIREEA